MAPRQNSPQKTKIAKKSKFASKLIDDIMSNLVESKVQAVKQNPKTLEKWMFKMKLSILKKVSQASKIAFIPSESSITSLQTEIGIIKKSIIQQRENIDRGATETMKKSRLSVIDQSSSTNVYQCGRFDNQAEKIKEQFHKVTEKLAINITESAGYVKSLNDNLIASESQWNQSKSQAVTSMAKNTRSHRKALNSNSFNSCELPVQVLFNHLSQS